METKGILVVWIFCVFNRRCFNRNNSKTLDGNKLGLKAILNVPKIVKDTEYVPWKDDKEAFLKKEVEKKWQITKEEKGYEIPFTKHFYVYQPLREQAKVVNEMAALESENLELMKTLGIELV